MNVEKEHEKLDKFIKEYEYFLNKMHCWEMRAQFSIRQNVAKNEYKDRIISNINEEQKTAVVSKRSIKSLRARCGFCGQNFDKQSIEELASTLNTVQTEQKLLNVCLKCRNQLPRCAICLQSLGILNPFMSKSGPQSLKPESVINLERPDQEHFFVWCQKCRHGGHLEHIEEWFSTHVECPVSECKCKCSIIEET